MWRSDPTWLPRYFWCEQESDSNNYAKWKTYDNRWNWTIVTLIPRERDKYLNRMPINKAGRMRKNYARESNNRNAIKRVRIYRWCRVVSWKGPFLGCIIEELRSLNQRSMKLQTWTNLYPAEIITTDKNINGGI